MCEEASSQNSSGRGLALTHPPGIVTQEADLRTCAKARLDAPCLTKAEVCPGRRWETGKETEAQRGETLAQGDTVGAQARVQALLWDPVETHGSTGGPEETALDPACATDSGAALTGRLTSGEVNPERLPEEGAVCVGALKVRQGRLGKGGESITGASPLWPPQVCPRHCPPPPHLQPRPMGW